MNAQRIAAVAALTAGASLALAGGALAAPGGYGPSVPTGPVGTPGGYTSVVTTETVAAAGGALSGSVAGGRLDISVPAGAFSRPVQVEVTSPNLSAITPQSLSQLGFGGYSAAAGYGVKVLDDSGQALAGSFGKSLRVTVHGAGLGLPGQKVLMLDGADGATVVPTTLGADSVTVQLSRDPNLVVITPRSAPAPVATVAGATSATTGKPFLGESVLGGLLIAAGAGAVVVSLRRRAAEQR